MNSNKLTCILGGTFDPIHLGHIAIARFILKHFAVSELRFIPCKQPVLKPEAMANSEQRLDMLRLVLQNPEHKLDNCRIDVRELERDTPSYMAETLRSLRDEVGAAPLALIMGSDAFLSLPKWHQWQQLLNYAHIIIVDRKHFSLEQLDHIDNAILKDFFAEKQTNNIDDLCKHQFGLIYQAHMPIIDISSTEIRNCQHKNDLEKYVSPEIAKYIMQNGLYNI